VRSRTAVGLEPGTAPRSGREIVGPVQEESEERAHTDQSIWTLPSDAAVGLVEEQQEHGHEPTNHELLMQASHLPACAGAGVIVRIEDTSSTGGRG
jgi:hypothetical protein